MTHAVCLFYRKPLRTSWQLGEFLLHFYFVIANIIKCWMGERVVFYFFFFLFWSTRSATSEQNNGENHFFVNLSSSEQELQWLLMARILSRPGSVNQVSGHQKVRNIKTEIRERQRVPNIKTKFRGRQKVQNIKTRFRGR